MEFTNEDLSKITEYANVLNTSADDIKQQLTKASTDNYLPLKLQFFSNPEETEPKDDDETDPEEEEKDGKKEDKKQEETVTLTQAQLDKMLADRERRALKDKEKAVEEAEKLAKMSADQKREYELDKLKRENEELKASQNRFELGKTATAILAESGIVADDEILDFVVKEDAEKTNNAVKAFIALIDKVSDDKMRDKLKGNAPKKQQTKPGSMTKEEILAIKDGAKRIQAIQENQHLFKN